MRLRRYGSQPLAAAQSVVGAELGSVEAGRGARGSTPKLTAV